VGGIGRSGAFAATGMRLDGGFSGTLWAAVLLLFVLARVFEEGSRMRADLEGTV
jgi:hypothetical protein